MSARKAKVTREERREINEFLPYLLSYSVDSMRHQQRIIDVQIQDLKKGFANDLSKNIQHVVSTITLHKKLAVDMPNLSQANDTLNILITELEKKLQFTDMKKVVEDKKAHSQVHQHLDDILEIARLPTTINSLIHKNDLKMAIKLINHFNNNIYDSNSELLRVIKNEVDILNNKIQQKVNVELEKGQADPEDIKLLLGDNPSQAVLKDYFYKKYEIRMDMLKQKLQKALFTPARDEGDMETEQTDTQIYTDRVLVIFEETFTEARTQNEEQSLDFNNDVYKTHWINALTKEFTDLMLKLIGKLAKDFDNLEYLTTLHLKLQKVDETTYWLTQEK